MRARLAAVILPTTPHKCQGVEQCGELPRERTGRSLLLPRLWQPSRPSPGSVGRTRDGRGDDALA
eukprot:3794022-Prymnesium_polylepis.1